MRPASSAARFVRVCRAVSVSILPVQWSRRQAALCFVAFWPRLVMTHPHTYVFMALDVVYIRALFCLRAVFIHFLQAVLSDQNLACIAQSAWQLWRPSASLRVIFPMPYLNVVSEDVLTAIRWTKSRGPRPTADRTIGERCIAGHHAQQSDWSSDVSCPIKQCPRTG